MGVSAATLAGHRVTSARATIPAWGCWYADATVDGEHALSGSVTLQIADLTLVGTVLSGGIGKGRSFYRIVAGAGGWGRTISSESYATDDGVKALSVVRDAAAAVGETFDASTLATTVRTGPAFARHEGPACHVLEILSPSRWYVGEDGITRIGRRPTTTLSTSVTHGPVDRARKTVTLAADSIAAILPGIVVDGMEAVDVLHEISAESGLRSTIWGAQASGTSRRIAALRAIFDQLDPARKFRGFTEYRVGTQDGERFTLQPVRVSTGMPVLKRVPARPGVSGCKSTLALGSSVIVGFVDSDPSRPFIAQYEGAEGDGFAPSVTEVEVTSLLKVNGASDFVALAQKVDTALSTIKASFDAHVHPTGVGPSGPPPPIGSLASTACTTLKTD